MFVCTVYESLIDLGEDHDDLILLDIGDRLIESKGLVKLPASQFPGLLWSWS